MALPYKVENTIDLGQSYELNSLDANIRLMCRPEEGVLLHCSADGVQQIPKPSTETMQHIVFQHHTRTNFYVSTRKNDVWLCEETSKAEGEHRMKRARIDRASAAMQAQMVYEPAHTIQALVPLPKDAIAVITRSTSVLTILRDALPPQDTQLPLLLKRILQSSAPSCAQPVEVGDVLEQQLDSQLAAHFGIAQSTGTLLGFDNGLLVCVCVDNEQVLAYTLMNISYESVLAAHMCRFGVEGKGPSNVLMAVGSRGTLMIYYKDYTADKETAIKIRDFTMPCSAVDVSFFHGASEFVMLGEDNQIYYTCLSLSSEGPCIKVRIIDCPVDAKHVIARHKSVDLLEFLVITSTSVQTVSVQLTADTVQPNVDEATLKNKIEHTLEALAELEAMQTKLDTQHNLINTRLVSMNKTLCMLQSVLQNRKRGDNADFDLAIQPFVRAAPLTGRPTMCLRVRLHTRLNLDWDKCHLNLDLCCRPSLLESSNGGGLREPVTSPGETISLVFDDMQPLDQEHASVVQYFWQREIELDTARLPLPLDVATHLVMHLGAPDVDPTEAPMDAGSEDQGDSTAVFFVMETAIDVLHYAVPVPAYFAKQITLNGFQAVAAQAHTGPNSQHRQQDHPLANAQSVIKLRFISMLDNDQLYRSILSTLLGEGLPEKHTSSVVRDAEHAYFALASQPKDFVHVELAKVVHHGDELIVTLTVMSTNKMVQLQVETALVSRLLMYTDDDIMDENGVSSLPKDFYERQRQLQEQLAVVEATYQQSVDDVIWRDLAQIHELICTQQANIAIPIFGFVDQNT